MGYGKQSMNAAPAHAMRARLDAGKSALEAALMRVNDNVARQTGGGSLRPFFLIPDSCWNGAMGEFLMSRLGLSPYESWNVAFLPVDEDTAMKLGAPLHPDGNIPAFIDAAETAVLAARDRLDAANDNAPPGELDEARAQMRALAAHLRRRLGEIWALQTAPSKKH